MKNKILLSSCLGGKPVRYNGKHLKLKESILEKLKEKYRLIFFCPEVYSGLPIPRNPVEISNGNGSDVFCGKAKALTSSGIDLSSYFIQGAQKALQKCLSQNIKIAILAENSPSCGTSQIYDGSFNSSKIQGQGVTAHLLLENGIKVFSQYEIEENLIK